MNEKDIRITKPKTDCKFCETRQFVDFHGNHIDGEYYAECRNREKSQGMTVIDITAEANPLEFTTSCHNCRHYDNRQQMTLF